MSKDLVFLYSVEYNNTIIHPVLVQQQEIKNNKTYFFLTLQSMIFQPYCLITK